MDREIDTCALIVGEILDFARERPPERRSCPLHPLVAEAMVIAPTGPNIEIKNEVPTELPIPFIDKDQIRQALINLIQNASEAIPKGRHGTVTITAGGGGGSPFRIDVRDDGVGMADTAQIFVPLFTTKSKGTGLGRAIVAGMVRRHGGSVSVASEVDRGSTFTIELPDVPASDGGSRQATPNGGRRPR